MVRFDQHDGVEVAGREPVARELGAGLRRLQGEETQSAVAIALPGETHGALAERTIAVVEDDGRRGGLVRVPRHGAG